MVAVLTVKVDLSVDQAKANAAFTGGDFRFRMRGRYHPMSGWLDEIFAGPADDLLRL